jgi:hypothetical protein
LARGGRRRIRRKSSSTAVGDGMVGSDEITELKAVVMMGTSSSDEDLPLPHHTEHLVDPQSG